MACSETRACSKARKKRASKGKKGKIKHAIWTGSEWFGCTVVVHIFIVILFYFDQTLNICSAISAHLILRRNPFFRLLGYIYWNQNGTNTNINLEMVYYYCLCSNIIRYQNILRCTFLVFISWRQSECCSRAHSCSTEKKESFFNSECIRDTRFFFSGWPRCCNAYCFSFILYHWIDKSSFKRTTHTRTQAQAFAAHNNTLIYSLLPKKKVKSPTKCKFFCCVFLHACWWFMNLFVCLCRLRAIVFYSHSPFVFEIMYQFALSFLSVVQMDRVLRRLSATLLPLYCHTNGQPTTELMQQPPTKQTNNKNVLYQSLLWWWNFVVMIICHAIFRNHSNEHGSSS